MTAPPPWLRSVQRGHAPNCSSAGSVVGWALTTAVGAAVVLNLFADRFLVWVHRGDDPPTGDADGSEADPPDVRVRLEEDGALVAWPDPPALLHVDRAMGEAALAAGARRVGGDGAAPAGALSAPTEAHLAVTDRCPVACTGCYLSAGPDRAPTEPEDLLPVLDRLAQDGVLEVAFGGGEALLRDDLPALAGAARARGLVPNVTTSGFGLTPTRARALASRCGQVNVSLDGLGAAYADTRGWDGAALGLRALRRLIDAGARVGVNTVLSGPLLAEPDALEALGRAIAQAGAVEWQWLRFKPTGRGAEAWDALAPTTAQLVAAWQRALALETETGLVIRWDCALTPFLAAHDLSPGRAARLGVHGCPGGTRLWARSAAGAWAPCSFAEASETPDWDGDPTLRAWRERAADPPEPCASCDWRAVCRGGCRVVARHLTGDALAPDPQCPRVQAHA